VAIVDKIPKLFLKKGIPGINGKKLPTGSKKYLIYL
jgi:hypothetical protein